jgi:predicted ATPase
MSRATPAWSAADRRSIRRIQPYDGDEVNLSAWPATVPAVAQILREGLELAAGVTVLIGENGSGKSTVIEVVAEACGLNPQGGSTGSQFRTRPTEPGVGDLLRLERSPGRASWSYFLRADTMHGQYTYLEENRGKAPDHFHQLSHGEGFLELLRSRVNQEGFYLMDEPDAPLSFVSCLGLVLMLHELSQAGAQAVIATHSPVLAAVPGARILELGEWGIRPAAWEDLELVAQWREFLRQPQLFLHHLVDDPRQP